MAWRLLAAALIAGAVAGCSNECASGPDTFIEPGVAYDGVDPRGALAALAPQALPSLWINSDETTTVTVTTTPADAPTHLINDCSRAPASFSVPAKIVLHSDDGRIDDGFVAEMPADLAAALKLPNAIRAQLPLTTLIGTKVAPETYLDPAANALGVYLEVLATDAGAAYGRGYLYLTGRDSVLVGVLGLAP